MKKNEATVSAENKLYAASLRGKLWRNNRGVGFRADGTPIRFGVGNESVKTNAVSRSPDQIGILPITITQAMVGKKIGVFLGVEDKNSEWIYSPTEHQTCQLTFINHVKRLHGVAMFATCTDDIKNAIAEFINQLES